MEKLKILVVDDESRMRKLVRDFLVKQNFDVAPESNAVRTMRRLSHMRRTHWRTAAAMRK